MADLNTSQFPLHVSTHLEHSPEDGTTFLDLLNVLEASFPAGLLKFIPYLLLFIGSLQKPAYGTETAVTPENTSENARILFNKA
jgi:hypothetical protein